MPIEFSAPRVEYELDITADGTRVTHKATAVSTTVAFGELMKFAGFDKYSKDTDYISHNIESHLEAYVAPEGVADLPIDFLRTGQAHGERASLFHFPDRANKIVVAYVCATEFTSVGGWDPSFKSEWDQNGDGIIDVTTDLPDYVDLNVFNAPWKGYVAAYWTESWRQQLKAKIDSVAAQHFDGVMLDVMTAYVSWKNAYPEMDLGLLKQRIADLFIWISEYAKSTYGSAFVVSANLDANSYSYFPDMGSYIDVGYFQNAFFKWNGDASISPYALTSSSPDQFTNPSIDFLKQQGMAVLNMDHLGTGPVSPGLSFENYDDRITTENLYKILNWAIESDSAPYVAQVFFGNPYELIPHFVKVIGTDSPLASTAFRDWVIGNDEDNTIATGPADDLMYGGVGDDDLDGGDGIDIAYYVGQRANYVISLMTDGSVLVHEGADTDTLWNVETAQFSDYTLTFGSDATAPTVMSVNPGDDAIRVAAAGNLTLTFSESVANGTGAITLKNLEGAVLETFDATTSTRLSISGDTLTIDPTLDLAYGTGYVLEFSAGAVQDLAGNAYAGSSNYNFTTTLVNPAVPKSAYYEISQKFYVAYFGRPADTGGLENMARMFSESNAPTNLLDLVQIGYYNNQTVKDIIDSFGLSQESSNLYAGSDTTARVTAVYNFMFNRAPDAGGLAFWVSNIDSGVLSLAKAALSIMQGAENWPLDDGLTVDKKVTVAQNFTRALDTPTESNAYAGDAAAAAVRAMLGGVDRSSDTGAYASTVLGTIDQLVAAHPAPQVGFQYFDGLSGMPDISLAGVAEMGAGA